MDMAYYEETTGGSMNRKRTLKNAIRDNIRLLAREDLPVTVRETKTRVLNMLLEEEEKRQEELHIRKMAKKYKMLKFFEKRKVTRGVSQLLSQFKKNQSESVIEQIQQHRGDLNYIVHFPLTKKYYSLFPTTPSNESTLRVRGEMYQKISAEVKDGVLEDALGSLCEGTVLEELPPIDDTLLPVINDPGKNSAKNLKRALKKFKIETKKEKAENRKKLEEERTQAAQQADSQASVCNAPPKKKNKKKGKNPPPQSNGEASLSKKPSKGKKKKVKNPPQEAPQPGGQASSSKKPSKGQKRFRKKGKNLQETASPAPKKRKIAACDQEGAPQVMEKNSFFI